jgi:hypothetical protein
VVDVSLLLAVFQILGFFQVKLSPVAVDFQTDVLWLNGFEELHFLDEDITDALRILLSEIHSAT